MFTKVLPAFHRQGGGQGRIRALPLLSTKAAPFLYQFSHKVSLILGTHYYPVPLPPRVCLFLGKQSYHPLFCNQLKDIFNTSLPSVSSCRWPTRPIKSASLIFFLTYHSCPFLPPLSCFKSMVVPIIFRSGQLLLVSVLHKMLCKGCFKQPLPKIPFTPLKRHSGAAALQDFTFWGMILRLFLEHLIVRYRCSVLVERDVQ